MIRLATAAELQALAALDEGAVRIGGLFRAYGCAASFLRFYVTEEGAVVAVMDGTATVTVPVGADTEELCLFLTAQPDIRHVHSTAAFTEALADFPQKSRGAVLKAVSSIQPVGITEPLAPRPLYSVIEGAFGEAAPPFEGFYVDVSHRMRHGCCRSAGVVINGMPVSCALTVAETETAAVIGGVATLPEYRQKGYAKACVTALTAALQAEQKRVLIAPQTKETERLYSGWGFTSVGTWGEAER